jgi:hypothetical protein
MAFFKKGIAFNKLAKSFNSTYIMLNELEIKLKQNHEDSEQDIYILAYICRKEILDRIEEYNWSMMSPIIVPILSKRTVSLTFAFEETIGRLQSFAEEAGASKIVADILEKGKSYFELERALPLNLRNNLS